MKNNPLTRLCVLFVFLLCVFEVSGQLPRTQMSREVSKRAMKREMRTFWNGDNTLMSLAMMSQDEFREGIGVSKEQLQKIETIGTNAIQDAKYLRKTQQILDEMAKLRSENPSPEQQAKLIELQDKMNENQFRPFINALNENTTPEQKHKLKEFQLSAMSTTPFVSPSMFEALNLSGGQKQQLQDIQKKMEPEFEKNLDARVDFQIDFQEKFQDELDDKMNYKDARKKVREKYPELQKKEADIRETEKAFANKLKFEMFDVLTDEQMERMAQLIDNPPDYVKKILAKMRKERGEEDESTTSGPWRPGLNSWQPGDPIPEEYREHRKKRFPSNSSHARRVLPQ